MPGTLVAKHTAGKPNLTGIIQWYIWQIEYQHPPTKLLELIRTEEQIGDAGRVWAIKRALDYGIAKDDIRDAILRFANEPKPSGASGNQRKWELGRIKGVAIELGILKIADLPDIEVPKLGTPGLTP